MRGLLALALSLVVACGGSTPAGSGANATPGGATATAGATSGAGQGTATAAATASAPALSSLLAAGKAAQYKVTYTYTITGAGALTGEQAWYFKPPKARFDFTMVNAGQSTRISYFTIPPDSFYCMAAGGATQCFTVRGIASPIDQNMAVVAQRAMMENPGAWQGRFVETKSYAGQQASCYDVSGSGATAAGLSSGRFCYSKEGIALFQSLAVQGATTTLEAKEFSLNVPDADFELPARPVSGP